MACVQLPAGAFGIDKVVKKRVFVTQNEVSEGLWHAFRCLLEPLASIRS